MKPALAVLIPFFRDDPSDLVAALADQARTLSDCGAPGQAALILYDDGSHDADLAARVRAALDRFPGPARLIAAPDNRGRAHARNALAEAGAAAGAPHLLFLDADMAPGDSRFLARWLEAARGGTAIGFGGFDVPRDAAPDRALHRAFSAAGDCLDAAARRANPAQYVFTSNLLVRADVLEAAPFDSGFAGWGWEDAEWAARAGARFPIAHIDNPALHLGLETAETLLARFRDSAGNYARFVARHPQLAATLASHRWALRLKRLDGARPLRPVLAALARGAAPAPMRARVLALKLWRASWYSEALP